MSLLSSLRHTVVLSAIFLGLGALQQARAATFIVTSTADTDGSTCDTNCTLRQAINAANGDPDDSNVITFDDTVFASKHTIKLTNYHNSGAPYVGLPWISSSVSIIGPTTPGSGLTISGDKSSSSDMMRINSPLNHTPKITIANIHITDATTGISNYGGDLTVMNCTFSDNAIGIRSQNCRYTRMPDNELYQIMPSILTLNNCTFAENSKFGIYHVDGTTRVNSCTVTGSDVGVSCWKGVVNVFNSLIVGNTSFNLCDYQEGDCVLTKVGQNITKGTPQEAGLDPRGLHDNGGPTPTIALIKGGAAVDAGTTDLLTDQRGKPRPPGDHTDIGAFEYDDKPSAPPSR
ncbi:hypothetical protein IAD21_01882 [Abditibacteriota bacterium]|nr:hypothetical protein IAD21_01882 [Abditibacteriota bacterium]